MLFKRSMVATVATLMLSSGCTMVDTTEHCVLTRYGRVVQEKMDTGLNLTPFTKATCFNMTEQNFPEGSGDEDVEVVSATTADPITVQGDVAVVWAYDPSTIYEVFLEKRTPQAVEVEVLNSIREGYRNAINGWTVDRIFSSERAQLAQDVRSHIQSKLGNRARVQQVFIRDIKIPPQIEEARIAAARQAQVLDQARKQMQIDSVNAVAEVMRAEATSQAKSLEAAAYAQNPQLLRLEEAKAMAEGLARACSGTAIQNCVIGGSVLDSWRRP